MTSTTVTTEAFLHLVRDLVIEDALRSGRINADEAFKLSHVKLLYGIGDGTYRGVCHYGAWENGVGNVDVVEIAASAQESWVQLTGTVIHELGHVLAGWDAGHGADWKATAARLGFTKDPAAAGQLYTLALLRSGIRVRVYRLAEEIGDGRPMFRTAGLSGLGPMLRVLPKPCSAGVGTRGGKSRGKGSGSRLRLWECECSKPVKVRVASDAFDATCGVCDQPFHYIPAKAKAKAA